MKILIDDRSEHFVLFLPQILVRLKEIATTVYLSTESNVDKPLRALGEKIPSVIPVDDPDSIRPDIVFLTDYTGSGEIPAKKGIPSLVLRVPKTGQPADFSEVRLVKLNKTKKLELRSNKDEGFGIFPHPQDLADLLMYLVSRQDLESLRILISAGPTAEDIDPVRFLTNRSSGKMGIALARAAYIRGAQVELICGPVQIQVPEYLHVHRVRSAAEMAEVAIERFGCCDIYIGSAAIADYTPQRTFEHKLKKTDGDLNLSLRRTKDVISELNSLRQGRQLLVGFSVETENELDGSAAKMTKKNLDMIIVNNPAIQGTAFSSDTNKVSVITRKNMIDDLPLMSKFDVADSILDRLIDVLKGSDE